MEIIKSSGTWWFPEYITTSFGEPPKITNSAEAFSYNGIIIYDGVTFLLGSYNYDSGKYIAVEVTTGGVALLHEEIGKIRDIHRLGGLLENKIVNCGRTVHEVVRDYFNRQRHLELWKINMFL